MVLPKPVDRMIFGGSFDPPHRGHIAIVQYVLEKKIARELDLIPAAVSPFKNDTPPTAGRDRLALLEAALRDLREAGVDAGRVHLRTLELERPPPSYTVDTCAALRNEFPGQRIGLLIGADSLAGLARWHRIADIVAFHPIYVFRRRNATADLTAGDPWRIEGGGAAELHVLDNQLVDCSSTELRADLGAGKLSDCLTAAVANEIERRRLYGYGAAGERTARGR